MQHGRYAQAVPAFDTLARRYPDEPTGSIFLFYRLKGQYYLGQYREAVSTLEYLKGEYPAFMYAPHVAYFAANCRYKLGDLAVAIGHYLDSYSRSQSEQLDSLVVKSLSAFDAALVESQLSHLMWTMSRDRQCRLGTEIVNYLKSEGRGDWIFGYLSWCQKPNNADRPLQKSTVAPARLLRVAVLVPLSGELQAFGEDLYNGAVIGAAVAQEENAVTIQLTPFDTKGDPIEGARMIKDISAQPFDAVVGPLTSDEASVASAALACVEIPMVIPAATDAGLTLLSAGSFQLSPNLELQGALMAEYAVRTLMADSAAVIAPTSVESSAMTRAFVERFKSLGGVVIAIERYRDRDKDFGAYIRDIKNVLLGRIPDSAVYLDDRGDTLETEAVPAHVDCLYLPGSPQQVRQLLTQLRFYNLSATYLGSDSWGDESIYNLSADVTIKAVFPSAFVSASSNSAYSSFAHVFNARYDRKPTRVASLGYDAVRLLAAALVKSDSSHGKLAASLQQTSAFEGASGRVTFGAHRENIELPLYRIAAGRPVPVEIAPAILESIKTGR